MLSGKMLKSGDVILTKVQFTDTFEIKTRPAVVLFEEFNNVVIAGITSNLEMKGISLTKKEGAIKAHLLTGKGWKAQKFYESLGYKQIAVFPKHHFGRDNLVYQKPL